MKVLAIETSCDETAVAVIDAQGGIGNAEFRVLGDALFSQTRIHEAYGGIYPNMAKRNHAQNMTPLLQAALKEAELFVEAPHPLDDKQHDLIARLLKREPELANKIVTLLERIEPPQVDAIAVTTGPGLEPALWVGVNAARVLSLIWNLPLIQTDHIEGHLISGLTQELDDRTYALKEVDFPVLALIVSGGHTDFVQMNAWKTYEYLGGTRDDALGEAYDKVGRMLDLPYPAGALISRLATDARREELEAPFDFPRPMMQSGDEDFSFSGLKTAVMYTLKEWRKEHGSALTEEHRKFFALEFENAVFDVIVMKVDQALKKTKAKTLVVSGGVSANKTLRQVLRQLLEKHHPEVRLALPIPSLATDNAVMIGMAGAMRAEHALAPRGEHENVGVYGNKHPHEWHGKR